MKNETGNKIRLGVFVSIAIALFIFVIYYIGNRRQMFSKTILISGTFKDVGGLQIGNNIRFAGINVGTIDAIEIVTDSTVRVDMVIEKNVQKFIKKDATASISSEGLMGNKAIDLLAGNPKSPMIEDGAKINTITPVSMDDIMKNLAVTSQNAALITDDISSLTYNVRTGKGVIGKIFMDEKFANTIDQTLVNARNAAGGFSENMEAAKDNFLLRGYYKKKEKEAEKLKIEAEKTKKKEAKQKENK